MAARDASPLKKSVELIRAGKLEKARQLLVPLLRTEPDNAQAWFLLSYTLDDPQRKQYALMQALRADPNFERAEARLRQLRGLPPAPPKPKPQPALAARPAAVTPTEPQPSKASPAAVTAPSQAAEVPFEQAFRNEMEQPAAEAGPASTGGGASRLLPVLGMIALLGLFALIFFYSRDFFTGLIAAQPTATEAQSFRPMPAVWTSTPDSAEPTATAEPATAEGEVYSLNELDEAALNRLALISQQVDAVRGLPSPGSVPPILLAESELGTLAADLHASPAQDARRLDDELALRAFGLLDESQTLADYETSRYVDPYGAVYAADPARVYLLGAEFSDTLAFAYARQYGQAVVQASFVDSTPSGCGVFSDECRAVEAFRRGDWELAGEQWLAANGTPAMSQAVDAAAPSAIVVQTEPLAAFAVQDLQFVSEAGLAFADELFEQGGWERINAAYAAPPSTTEQIMHPEKYASGEAAIAMTLPAVTAGLGPEWALHSSGSLGEALTLSLLTAGADEEARLIANTARDAAEGWGGDAFQVLLRRLDGEVALAQQWVMDSEADAGDLYDAMESYLDQRFSVAGTARSGGACWRAAGRMACLLQAGSGVLWVQTPDEQQVLDAIVAQFEDFQ